jgi:H+/Na+-translocating ferredoxin:NAD+ oxidoreductase subunit B
MVIASLVLGLQVAVGVWMLLHHLDPERDSTRRIILRIDAILPQTQCRQCGYPGCLPYAEAIVSADAPIDRCPPGGPLVRRSLAELLGRTGISKRRAADATALRQVVVIDEPACIGCAKCIRACPVDAMIGAAKQMHTVVSAQCTGCELCIAPCPVDCINIVNVVEGIGQWRWPPPPYFGADRRGTARA